MRLKSRVNHQKLARRIGLAMKDAKSLRSFTNDFRDAVKKGEITFEDVNIKHLYEHLVKDGAEALRAMDSRSGVNSINFLDSSMTGAVDTGAFQFVTGQLVQETLMDSYNKPKFIGSSLVTVEGTTLDGETEANLTEIGDQAEEVGEGEEIPDVGLGEDYIEINKSKKKALKISLTKEMLLLEKTGELSRKCARVGDYLGVNHEKERIDFATGVTGTFKRKGYSATAPYGDDSGDHDWDNLIATNPLSNWRALEAAELALLDITDPHDGEPVVIDTWQLLLPHALRRGAMQILDAGEVSQVDNTVDANTIRITGANPWSSSELLEVLHNQYVSLRTGSPTTWFMGDFKQAIVEKELWPVTVETMPAGTIVEWSKQVVAGWSASRRSVLAWRNPRLVNKNTA